MESGLSGVMNGHNKAVQKHIYRRATLLNMAEHP